MCLTNFSLFIVLGHLGHFTLNIPWANLTSKPAEIIIEDLYLLVVPAGHSTTVDLDEEETSLQASKQERLKNAEVLRQSSSTAIVEGEKNQGLFESLINKVVNNLQITVKNIHIRYEDNLSVPGVSDSPCSIYFLPSPPSTVYVLSLSYCVFGTDSGLFKQHPFAVGITLSEFAAVSTDDTWHPAFTPGGGVVHKLARLDSFGIYFNTDAVRFGATSSGDKGKGKEKETGGRRDAGDPINEKVMLEAFRDLVRNAC